MESVTISKDKDKLDVEFVHNFLTQSYWAEGRSVEKVRKTIEHSTCYGMYLDERQIGFARVVSDKYVYAYILDVFVDESLKGKGCGQQLMKAVLEDPEWKNVERWMLATKDAQDFYRKFGFDNPRFPERVMGLLKIKNDVHI